MDIEREPEEERLERLAERKRLIEEGKLIVPQMSLHSKFTFREIVGAPPKPQA